MSQSDSHKSLSIQGLKFLLMDFVSKLENLLLEKDMGLQNLQTVAPIHIIKDCSLLLVFIERHLKVTNIKSFFGNK